MMHSWDLEHMSKPSRGLACFQGPGKLATFVQGPGKFATFDQGFLPYNQCPIYT